MDGWDEPGPAERLRARLRAGPIGTSVRYVRSELLARRDRAVLAGVGTYCLFIGHARSGHSILGALLDAHRRAVISDELDALRFVSRGFRRDQVLELSVEMARHQARAERRKAGRDGRVYSYFVPGQWQGRFERLDVVGDSRAGWTVRRLAADPGLLGRVEALMQPSEVRFIHVLRNPFDNISTMVIRSGRWLDDAIDRYLENCRSILALAERTGPDRILRLRHEALVTEPRPTLARACTFLGLDAPDEYLDACAGILFAAPSRTRDRVAWEPADVGRVERGIEEFEFLRGYGFDR